MKERKGGREREGGGGSLIHDEDRSFVEQDVGDIYVSRRKCIPGTGGQIIIRNSLF